MSAQQKNCLLCGVGGQGTVLASRILAQCAMEKGMFARTAETIGMAQRGGCVVSHVRIGDGVSSSLVPLGTADVLIGFEPGEAVRCLPYLKPDGVVVVSSRPVQPVTASLSGNPIAGEPMLECLKAHAHRVIVVDADEAFAACGSAKVLNTVLLGAACADGVLGFTMEEIEHVMASRMRPAVFEMNRKALALGASYAK